MYPKFSAPLSLVVAIILLLAHGLLLMATSWFFQSQYRSFWFSFSQALAVFGGTIVLGLALLNKRKWAWWTTIFVIPLLCSYEMRLLAVPMVFNLLNLLFSGFETENRALLCVMTGGTLLMTISFVLLWSEEVRTELQIKKNK